MNYFLKIASRANTSSRKSTYIKAGQAKREGRYIEIKVERWPAGERKMYLYGVAGHLFPRGMRAKRILAPDGSVIGKAAVTPHQKALVLHLEAHSDQFVIEMIRAPQRAAQN